MRAGSGPGQGFHIIDPGRAGLARNLYFQFGPGRAGIIEHMFKSGPGRASKFGQMQDSNLDARYVSSSESIWRIYRYKMHGRKPNVQRLAVHLPDHQAVTFSENDNLHNIINHETTLTAWFQENENNINARNYKYADFPVYYTWDATNYKWNLRNNITGAI